MKAALGIRDDHREGSGFFKVPKSVNQQQSEPIER